MSKSHDLAIAACRSIRFAMMNSMRHGGEFNLGDILAASKLAEDALALEDKGTMRGGAKAKGRR